MATRTRQPEPQFLYSPAITVSTSATFGLGTNLAWDAYVRTLYIRLNMAFDRQALLLAQRSGDISNATRALTHQRDLAAIEMRRRSSPFGRKYAEIIKPLHIPVPYEARLRLKGSDQAILRSVGKPNAVINRLNVVTGVVGRGAVIVQITLSAVLIVKANRRIVPELRPDKQVRRAVD